jgi:hypothetical protein
MSLLRPPHIDEGTPYNHKKGKGIVGKKFIRVASTCCTLGGDLTRGWPTKS